MLVQIALHAQNKGNQWCIDNRCSSHMTGDQTKFLTLKEVNIGSVTFWDNTTTRIVGKGTLSLDNGNTKIEIALNVEGLKQNLLSVSQMCDQGHNITFNSQGCETSKEGSGILVESAYRTSNNVFILNEIQAEKCYMGKTNEIWLWHRRIGHMNFNNLVKNDTKQAVRDMPKIVKPSNTLCKQCQHGKQTRTYLNQMSTQQQSHWKSFI